jgi:hypothetical protein
LDYERNIIFVIPYDERQRRASGPSGREEERVARYGKAHKQATRQRIIETAGHRLKQDGIDGSG